MAALRQTGSHCGGPGAGQVLPETQIPPKQSPSCLPVTGRGILRAFPGKGLGPGHKGSIFSREAAWSRLQAAARGARTFHPALLGLAASSPPCWATPGAAGHWLGHPCKLPAGCGLCSSSITRRSSAGPEFASEVLHKRLCGQAGSPGTKSVPGQSRARRCCAGGAWLHPRALAGSSTAGDGAFPARGIPNRAQPRLWAQDAAPLGADALC